jgi:UDP-galactopyranose mutase
MDKALKIVPPKIVSSDLIVFSHLRWDFVFQRPQQIMSRLAKERTIYFFEEPKFTKNVPPHLSMNNQVGGNLKIVVPQLPEGLTEKKISLILAKLVDQFLREKEIVEYTAWYYTPMALSFTSHLRPKITIYDCMDELSAFKNAPASLREYEKELLRRADVVFTGGYSLWEAKKALHNNVYPMPSSIDANHFMKARLKLEDPADQKNISHLRLGFFGVIDERLDSHLLERVASLRPDWNIIMIGPVVKIDPASLPQQKNIHYLGMKDYQELPNYISGWDVAILPFARNESTRFISPTKTPEYLAAGKPVVSTSIRDVVRPYGKEKLVAIADTPEDFISATEDVLARANGNANWLTRVDSFLAEMSWDNTCYEMMNLESKSLWKCGPA